MGIIVVGVLFVMYVLWCVVWVLGSGMCVWCVREVAVVCNVWAFVLLRNVFLVNLSKITNIIAKCSITKIVKNKS